MSDTSPMYQWSVFSPDGKEQVVIRSDDRGDFDEAVEVYRHFFQESPVVKPTTEAPTTQNTTDPDMGSCAIHKKPFVKGPYGYYCKTRMPDGTWCRNKPYSQNLPK